MMKTRFLWLLAAAASAALSASAAWPADFQIIDKSLDGSVTGTESVLIQEAAGGAGSTKRTTISEIRSGLATSSDLTTHTGDTSNPHSVTAAQAGALPTGTKLDDLGAPDDNTDLNASTSAHGLLPKLDNNSAHFLDGTGSWSATGGTVIPGTVHCRLTTESGVPVSTSDRTAQSTIYCAPTGDRGLISALYDGSAWQWRTCASEPSLTLSSLTSGKNYDVFLYWTGSACALELSSAWTNDTTRADALTTQDGVYVKSVAATRLLIGTLRTTGTSTTADASATRYLANVYNLSPRTMLITDATASWTYNPGSDTWRQANGSSINQVAWVIALRGKVSLNATGLGHAPTGWYVAAAGIGIGSTSANSAQVSVGGPGNVTYSASTLHAEYRGWATAGYQYAAWLERGRSGVTLTYYGAQSTGGVQTGMMGEIWQ